MHDATDGATCIRTCANWFTRTSSSSRGRDDDDDDDDRTYDDDTYEMDDESQ